MLVGFIYRPLSAYGRSLETLSTQRFSFAGERPANEKRKKLRFNYRLLNGILIISSFPKELNLFLFALSAKRKNKHSFFAFFAPLAKRAVKKESYLLPSAMIKDDLSDLHNKTDNYDSRDGAGMNRYQQTPGIRNRFSPAVPYPVQGRGLPQTVLSAGGWECTNFA